MSDEGRVLPLAQLPKAQAGRSRSPCTAPGHGAELCLAVLVAVQRRKEDLCAEKQLRQKVILFGGRVVPGLER